MSEHKLSWLTVVSYDTTVFLALPAIPEESTVDNKAVVIEPTDVMFILCIQ